MLVLYNVPQARCAADLGLLSRCSPISAISLRVNATNLRPLAHLRTKLFEMVFAKMGSWAKLGRWDLHSSTSGSDTSVGFDKLAWTSGKHRACCAEIALYQECCKSAGNHKRDVRNAISY